MRVLLKRKLEKPAFCDGVSFPSRFVLRCLDGGGGRTGFCSDFSVPCDWRLKFLAGSTADTELQQEKSVLEIADLRILADK